MHCIDLAQERGKFWAAVNMAMNIVLPEYIRNFLTSSGTISFSRRTLLLGLSYGHQGMHPTDTPPARFPLPIALWASSGTTVLPHHYTPAIKMFSSETYLLSFSSGAKYMKATHSINSPIIPLRNIGHPQESSTALYSWRRTWFLPGLFHSFGLFNHCSSPRILRSPYPLYLFRLSSNVSEKFFFIWNSYHFFPHL